MVARKLVAGVLAGSTIACATLWSPTASGAIIPILNVSFDSANVYVVDNTVTITNLTNFIYNYTPPPDGNYQISVQGSGFYSQNDPSFTSFTIPATVFFDGYVDFPNNVFGQFTFNGLLAAAGQPFLSAVVGFLGIGPISIPSAISGNIQVANIVFDPRDPDPITFDIVGEINDVSIVTVLDGVVVEEIRLENVSLSVFAVPEPTALSLLGLGLLGLMAIGAARVGQPSLA